MGLLASQGLTHHLLSWAQLRCCLFSSSSYSITMAATPIRMLKWASSWLNSCLLSIVTTAGMTGENKVTDFYTCVHIWWANWRSLRDHLMVTPRWPAGGLPAIARFIASGWRSTGLPSVIAGSPGDRCPDVAWKFGHLGLIPVSGRTAARQWSASDRWLSYQNGSRSSKSAGELLILKISKSARHPMDIRGIQFNWDVGINDARFEYTDCYKAFKRAYQ